MSTKSKLLAMTEGLQVPPEIPLEPSAGSYAPPEAGIDGKPGTGRSGQTPPQTKFPPVQTGPAAAKTGPGQMLQFRGQILAKESELVSVRAQLAEANDRLQDHEGSTPTRKLDPALIVPSRWANRHPAAFLTAEFARLKDDIKSSGGNVQPISVRALRDQPGQYEVVFGHRRHRACAELGIPVLATIDTGVITDHELFSAMDRENRERADLSPYEQGTMYRRALDEGLFPSNRRLAEALGVSHTWVANVLAVADLPAQVVACFASPLEIQHRHAKVIAAALEQDRRGVLRRAEKLGALPRRLATTAVVDNLVGSADSPNRKSARTLLSVGGRAVGSWARDRAGRITIELDPGAVADDRLEDVIQKITRAIGG